MRNPLRSEAEAFRFLVVSIVGALVIVAGAFINTWVGVAAAEVLVVAPALASPVKHWVSDVDSARAAAQERVRSSVARLAETGLVVRGEVGDQDPLQAIEAALRTFGADEILISTHPEGRSHWLERGVVAAARERFAVPITHVVVDLEAEAGAVER